MTSTVDPPPPRWDFQPVFDFIDAIRIDHNPPEPTIDPRAFDPTAKPSVSLGDFDRLQEFLGWKVYPRQRAELSDSPPHQRSHWSTPPSSLLSDSYSDSDHDDSPIYNGGRVRFTDQPVRERAENSEIVSKSKSRRMRRRTQVHDSRISADIETEPEETQTFRRPKQKPQSSLWLPPGIPASARIDFPPPPHLYPIESLTLEEKRWKVIKKLSSRFGHSLQYDIYLSMAPESRPPTMENPAGVHVFVDCSNVVIGWLERIKSIRGYPKAHLFTIPPLCWESLSLILERGRPCARRILLGSHISHKNGQPRKLPDYILDAEKFGYEINVLERVLKYTRVAGTPRKNNGEGSGYATTSGYSSSEGKASVARKLVNVEQAVDEVLHMKILESIVDSKEPSTIVLASGDATEAEYSGGFLKNVKRALEKGWKVELVSWSDSLGKEYRANKFLSQWKDQFTFINLDDYSEDILATYVVRHHPQ